MKAWNEEYEWPRFFISSASDAFSALEKRYGKDLPQFKGDLTPYWEDGAGSSALETGMNRGAADCLAQAEALAAMLSPGSYRPAAFREAWRNVLLYSEHTWGAWCSVSDSENIFTKKQWDVKRSFVVNAQKQSESLLANILRAHGSGGDNAGIDVRNSTSWRRTELIVLPEGLSAAGDHVNNVRGVAVPSQRFSTGELGFLAEQVPTLGSARFHISAAKPEYPVARRQQCPHGIS